MTRHYFGKAIAPAPKPARKPRPNHKGKMVLIELGPGQFRAMSSREYAMQLGRQKGGQTAQARGTAHRWTSEEARKAAQKVWKTRWRMNRKIGIRLGRPARNLPAGQAGPMTKGFIPPRDAPVRVIQRGIKSADKPDTKETA